MTKSPDDIKRIVDNIVDDPRFHKDREAGVKLSHDILEYLAENDFQITPLVLTLALSHTLGHVLMTTDKEDGILVMVGLFLRDLDVPHTIEAWRRQDEEEDHDEEEHAIH